MVIMYMYMLYAHGSNFLRIDVLSAYQQYLVLTTGHVNTGKML